MAQPAPNSSTTSRRQARAPCVVCFNTVKWVPVLFITCIILWSYYAFVFQLCIFTIEATTQQILYLLMYHILFVLFVWAYCQTIFTRVGVVPTKFKLPAGELERLAHADSEEMQNSILERFCKDLPNRNRTASGAVRYCDKCRHIKPDRAHHCSVCGKCILKMDHHCPWVNNCVCFTNYKFFILFLGYALIYCIYISLTSVEYFILFWRGHHSSSDGCFHILFLFFVAVMFAVSLASLFFYHVYLLSVNRTTLEAFRAPIFITGEDKHAFDLGRAKNFQEVFGDKPKLWFLPVFSTLGDGINYDKRRTVEDLQELLGGINVEDE